MGTDNSKFKSEVLPYLKSSKISSFLKSFLHFLKCLAGIQFLGYKQGFLIADLLIAVSHFKSCFLRSCVKEIDHKLHKCGFR